MITTDVRPPRAPKGVRRPGAALLLVAPLAMALARALLVPMDDQDWDATMSEMAAHQGRSDMGWLLAIAASGLLAITAASLAGRLRGRRDKTAVFAVIATALGWVSCATIGGGGLLMSEMGRVGDREAEIRVLDAFNDGSAGFVFLLSLIGALGYVVLAIGLARSHVTTRGAAVLIGLGGATTLLTMPGPLTPLLVATALLLAAGHGLALRTSPTPSGE